MFYLAIIIYVILSFLSFFLLHRIEEYDKKSSTKHLGAMPIGIDYASKKNGEKDKYTTIKHFTSVIIVVICLLTLRYLFNIEFVWQITIGLALGLATPAFACFVIIFLSTRYFEKRSSPVPEKLQYSYLHKINIFRNQIICLFIVLLIVLLFLPSVFLLGFIFAQIIILLRTHGLKMEYLQKEKKSTK